MYGEISCQEKILNGVNGWSWIWQPIWTSGNTDNKSLKGEISSEEWATYCPNDCRGAEYQYGDYGYILARNLRWRNTANNDE
jgi:hypothetical protein